MNHLASILCLCLCVSCSKSTFVKDIHSVSVVKSDLQNARRKMDSTIFYIDPESNLIRNSEHFRYVRYSWEILEKNSHTDYREIQEKPLYVNHLGILNFLGISCSDSDYKRLRTYSESTVCRGDSITFLYKDVSQTIVVGNWDDPKADPILIESATFIVKDSLLSKLIFNYSDTRSQTYDFFYNEDNYLIEILYKSERDKDLLFDHKYKTHWNKKYQEGVK